MSLLYKLEQQAKKVTQSIALIGLSCLLLQALAVMVDVLMRWIFNSPLFGMEDVSQLLLSVIIASFFPALLMGGSNITINFLGRSLGSTLANWFDVFGQLVTLLLFIIVSWELLTYANEVRDQTTLILQLPIAPSWWLAALLVSLCVPVQAIVTLQHLKMALGGDSGSDKSTTHISGQV